MKINFKEFFYLSNLLSLSRIFLLFPWAYLLSLNTTLSYYLLIILSIIMILTDSLDGYFARKLNQITDLGILLDPIADKLAMAAGMILLIIYRDFPLPLVILLVYRDIMIVLIGWLVLRKMQKPVMANFMGKINTTVISITILLAVINLRQEIFTLVVLVSYLTIVLSGLSYARTAEQILFKTIPAKIMYYIVLAIVSVAVILFCLPFNWI
jgi:cardiolipin synthase (CMP-forming)